MDHNLTDNQLAALRWLMEQIENGELKESFILGEPGASYEYDKDAYGLLFLSNAPDYLNAGSMGALATNGSLIVENTLWTITRRAYEITTFDFDNPQPNPLRTFIKETRLLMRASFNQEELEQVCFGLDINTDWIFGDKRDWPFELLRYLYRNNRLDELPPVLQQERSNVNWPEYPSS